MSANMSVTPVTNTTSNTLNVKLQQLNANSVWKDFASTTVASTTTTILEGTPTSNGTLRIMFSGKNASFKIGPVLRRL